MQTSMLDLSEEMLARYRAMRETRPVGSVLWKPLATNWPGTFTHPNGLHVIETVNRERDGKLWHHVSTSRRSRVPDWYDMKLVREDFVGDDRESYMVFAPAARWVNTHPNTLHLWCCLDATDGVLPDFRHLGQV
jgi:hypothetical protein